MIGMNTALQSVTADHHSTCVEQSKVGLPGFGMKINSVWNLNPALYAYTPNH